MRQRWKVGDAVVRREVKGLSPLDDGDRSAPWFGRAWIEVPMRVVEDTDDHLAIFVASNTPFTFPDGVWEAGKEHPWKANGAWRGHGCLMVQDLRVEQETFTPELADWIRSYGIELGERLDRGGPWWDTAWATWEPPVGWEPEELFDWPTD